MGILQMARGLRSVEMMGRLAAGERAYLTHRPFVLSLDLFFDLLLICHVRLESAIPGIQVQDLRLFQLQLILQISYLFQKLIMRFSQFTDHVLGFFERLVVASLAGACGSISALAC
jgi:hypothetical protein